MPELATTRVRIIGLTVNKLKEELKELVRHTPAQLCLSMPHRSRAIVG